MGITVERIGTTSITYSWQVRAGGAVCVEGSHTTVHLDDGGRPAPIPDALRSALTPHLRK